MFSKIRQWKESGLSQKSFCKQHGIAYHSFHHYYKKWRDIQESKPAGFVPLQIPDLQSEVFAMLSFPNGLTLQLHQAVTADYLKSLVD
jgi:hypothetical protein